MSIAHRQTAGLSSDGSPSISGAVEDVGSVEHQVNELIAAGTDTALAIAFAGDDVQSFILLASQDLTIEVNSGGSPAATIALKAGIPYTYSRSAGYHSNPFAGITVATWYLTNTAASRLKARILVS